MMKRYNLLLIALIFLMPAGVTNAQTVNAGGHVLVEKVESPYNTIFLYRTRLGYYLLSFHADARTWVESMVNPADELELPVPYTRYMTAGVIYPEKLEKAAIIGMGGGRTAWYLHKSIPGMDMTAVELDPEVVRLATTWLGINEEAGFDIVTSDGRIFFSRAAPHAD